MGVGVYKSWSNNSASCVDLFFAGTKPFSDRSDFFTLIAR